MKTFTFIMCFVAILGLIEANWRIVNTHNFGKNDVNKFLPLVESAMLTTGNYADKMEFLQRKMDQNWPPGFWSCIYGRFGLYSNPDIYIAIRNGNDYIVCFAIEC